MRYFDFLLENAKNKIPERWPCNGYDRTSTWFRLAFEYADDEIRVYGDNLHISIINSPSIVGHAQSFLRRHDTKLRILTRDVSDANMEKLKENFSIYDNCHIRKAVGSYAKSDAKLFSVIDRRGFRFESETIHLCNFNERNTAKKLIEAFDEAISL